jgi:hypothetical protein
MNELMTVLGKEIFRHQMTKGELFEANTKIQSLRSKLEVAVDALKNWLAWEDEQVRKDGAYVRPEINELIKNGKQALETIEAQDA